VGEDGSTHHGIFDYSFLRNIPNLVIMAPSSSRELQMMLWSSVNKYGSPSVIRYPRGCVPSWELDKYNTGEHEEIELGKSRLIYENLAVKDYVVIYAIGFSAYIAKIAAEEFVKDNPGIGIKVYDARFVKPLDRDIILSEAAVCSSFITVEENVVAGGFGSAVLECIVEANKTCDVPFYMLGISDGFIEHGTQAELRSEAKIDIKAVYDTIQKTAGKRSWPQRSENQNPIHH